DAVEPLSRQPGSSGRDLTMGMRRSLEVALGLVADPKVVSLLSRLPASGSDANRVVRSIGDLLEVAAGRVAEENQTQAARGAGPGRDEKPDFFSFEKGRGRSVAVAHGAG